MRKLFLRCCAGLIFFVLISSSLYSQAYFNFNCLKDTLINGCSTSCFNLTAVIPDIHGSSASYTINPASAIVSCLPGSIPPGGSGTPTNLTIDDNYSPVITLGFPFSFFGTTYTQLVASTNGIVSFDVTNANQFSHYSILNAGGFLSATSGTPQDLPSTLYDKALIMGPYHDLDPAYTTSPTQKIQYSVIGTFPHRKWVLSFYRVPLFLTACQNLIENTHQIILYESTGIVEVFVYSTQVCTGWNDGRAMIGMQNFNRDQAIMVAGRRASDPQWGTVNMNESWRFVPSGGPSLLKRTELYTLSGTLIGTGTTTSNGNGTLKASFGNVCPPAGVTSYIVKSVYQKNDNVNIEVFGLDTIRVTKTVGSSVKATAAVTSTNCNNNTGSVTVNASNGTAPYQYSINGGPYQASNIFSGLAQNSYTVTVKDANTCTHDTLVAVALQNNLTLSTTLDTTICFGASFLPNTVSNATVYTWSPPAGVSNVSVPKPSLSPQATTTYSVNAVLGVCSTSKTFKVIVVPGAAASAGPDATIISGDVYQLLGSGSTGTYLWTPPSGLSSATILNPNASPQVTTTYTLKVTSPIGCTATDDVTIAVVPYCIKPMGAFTPNGDGINDLWLVTNGTGCLSSAKVQVYNRNGGKVFEAQDYKNNWNGTYNGKPLPDGTYYFVITYRLINGKDEFLKGNVTILR